MICKELVESGWTELGVVGAGGRGWTEPGTDGARRNLERTRSEMDGAWDGRGLEWTEPEDKA